ncbi:MAG: AMP-binding protein [Gammaproteobacteria bacterium]|nr:AMP-binding protein [Gammaproteobacteria bacterium]
MMTDHEPTISDADLGDALLDELRGLLHELQPQQAPVPRLDSDIDRELGIDSLGRVELVVRLEQRFGVRLDGDTFARVDTPRDLLDALRRAGHAALPERPPASPPASVAAAATALPEQAQTLPEVLRWHAARSPRRLHIRLLDGDHELRSFTYRQLLDDAQDAAAGLQARNVRPGDRVALMLPTGADYFVAFFAILLCGAVPVPMYPPVRRSQLAEHLRRHAGILGNCRAVVLVTVAEARPLGRLLQARAAALRAVVTLADVRGADVTLGTPASAGDDIAFLQYTSGSTGSPKGVILSHADLLANIRAMGAAIEAGPDDVFVSWLPLYHDMGLIGAWLGSLYYGIPLVIMSPLDFISRPLRWLQAISRYRGTLSASPNFGYELCLKRISEAQLGGLDLSSWRGAFNGAEPVSPLTLQRFAERFAAAGLRHDALMPVYGLAEAAVGLAFPPLGRGPLIDRVDRAVLSDSGVARPAGADDPQPLRFPSCGRALPGYALRVVDEDGQVLPDRHQGRVEFRGPSATRGYFDNPDESARLRDGDWLDSGDLGYLAGGELYLTGRRKDIVIRAGRNLYPQELEDVVGDIPGVRKGCVAVFGSRDPVTGTERLVVMAESRRTDPAAQAELRRQIMALATDIVGTPPEVIALVPPHAVLKTSSGKIRRSANREAFEAGRIAVVRRGPGALRLALASVPGLLRRASRRLREHAFAAWGWVAFWLLAPTTWLIVAVLPTRRSRFAVSRFMARSLMRLTATPLRVDGLEHLPPPERPCVLVVNHASYLDGPILIAALPRELAFVAKEALASQFIAGTYLRRMGAEFVERFDPRRGLDDLKRIRGIGETGRSLVFFAEGTFSALPGLRPFRMGAFVTAMEAQLPVVPVAIAGARDILHAGSWYPHRGRLAVSVGAAVVPPPPETNPSANWRAALRLRDRARDHILRHCGEPDLAGGAVDAGPQPG